MDVREKLVELTLNADSDKNLGWYDLYDLCHAKGCAKYFADYLIAHGVTVQEWISVKDRLPENDTRVLVYLNIEKLDAHAHTIFDTDRMLDGKWIRWNTYITHWTPLPQPPKGE